MTSDESNLFVDTDGTERPEFTTEWLAIDAATATEHILDAVGSVTATETSVGTKIRTHRGMLIAIVTEVDDETTELQYRTAPPSDPATLKAQRLWRAMQPYAK